MTFAADPPPNDKAVTMGTIALAAVAAMLAFGSAWGAEKKTEFRDPELTIPWCGKAPKIDGALSPGEWDFAAAVSMFEAYPCYWPRAMRHEQPVFFVFRDEKFLYVAMESLDSSTTGIVAACAMNDNMRIIGDDCVEMMIAPGAGDLIKQYDFPTYYFALNSIGTVWDCKFVPLLAETHNSWQSGVETASSAEGTYWSCEMRIPLASIRKNPPAEGEVWRMNFDRTYAGYNWSAWNAAGGLNDCRVGGNVTFDRTAPAVRLRSVQALVEGRLQAVVEAANATEKPRTLTVTLSGVAADGRTVGSATGQLAVKPGELKEMIVGKGETLAASNVVTVRIADEAGRTLYFTERQVNVPAPVFVRKKAPNVPLVYVFPRFLPSLERLAVLVDYTAFARKTGFAEAPRAEMKVWKKGGESGAPLMEGTLTKFADNKGTWRASTKNLPEGEYTVKVRVLSAGTGAVLLDYDDWFEKRIFDWMKNPAGVGERVPAPYTAVEAKGGAVGVWGRSYRFGRNGLPEGVTSQGRELLAGKAELIAEVEGGAKAVSVEKPFSVVKAKPTAVEARTELAAGNLKISLETVVEYDGFVLYRLTYGPKKGTVAVDRMRVKLPLAAKHALFYSAAGDTQGTCIQGDLLPARQGKVYDSASVTRSVCCSPTFASLFWTGDHDVCFCYAADSDKGWLIRDDAPAVEAWREGDTVALWLNLVDKRFELKGPRTLEFALQAGPLKPLPEGWRGIQDSAHPNAGPLQLVQVGGSGNPMPGGGLCFIHPGETPQEQQRSREYLERAIAGGNKKVMGYTYWPKVPKGFQATRVFRGEWGIDKQTWDAATGPASDNWHWKNRFFGEDKGRYVFFDTGGRPSYVDFLTHAYDLALSTTPLCGTYDDCGYPNPIYDEELGFGFVREDGRKIWSSGLWNYRERWKRAAYVNSQRERINLLSDSQHCHAHFMPAYGFIGMWRPCERGYYNPFPDRDNLGFYGSLERYAAYNPSKQFGQVGQIGMSSPQTDPALKARDTRCMMMLAMLNDQDLGSWNGGARDGAVIGGLRAARNRFRHWEKDVAFSGYWESGGLVRTTTEGAKVSLYRRPGAALVVVGNVLEKPVAAVLTPVWKELGIDPAKVKASDAETDLPVAVGGTLTVDVKPRDVRVILIAPAGAYPKQAQ